MMKLHMHETDPQKASDHLKLLVSKASYLRMITPRVRGDRDRFNIASGSFVLRDGELVQVEPESKGKRCDIHTRSLAQNFM